MPLVNKAIADAALKTVRLMTTDAFANAGDGEILTKVAMKLPNTTPELTLQRLFSFATMKKWQGERKLSDKLIKEFVITSDLYESTIDITREEIQHDRLGMKELDAANVVDSYRRKRRRHAVNTLLGNAVGVDGLPIFSTVHPLFDADGGTYSNYMGASFALTGANYDAAVKKMLLITDHQGEPLSMVPDTLIYGPELRETVRDLFDVKSEDGGAENVYAKENLKFIMDPLFGSSEAWFLMDSSSPLKPIIVMDVPRPSGSLIEYSEADRTHERDALELGISARWGMAGGVWQTIVGGNFAI